MADQKLITEITTAAGATPNSNDASQTEAGGDQAPLVETKAKRCIFAALGPLNRIVSWILHGLAILVVPGAILLAKEGYLPRFTLRTDSADIVTFSDRVFFTFEWFVLIAVWLAFSVAWVIRCNCKSTGGCDPTVQRSELSQEAQRLLTNSIEQAVLTIVAQLALVPFITGEETIRLIPLINLAWFIGRIAFFYGYPQRRGIGFGLSYFASLAIIAYSFVLFFQKNFYPIALW